MGFVDPLVGEFAGEKGKPSHTSEGLQFMGKYAIIKSGQVAYANIHTYIARGKIILLDTGIIIAPHPVVNIECENSMNFGG